jgi:hypothetical protein
MHRNPRGRYIDLSEEAPVEGTIDRSVAIAFIMESIRPGGAGAASRRDFTVRPETLVSLEHKSDDQLRTICLKLAGLP